MIFNELNEDLPTALVIRILTLLKQMLAELPLKGLTPDERVSIRSVADGRLPYVLKLVEYCRDHREKIGMSVEDLAELERYAQMFADLNHLYNLAENLYVGLRDTRMQASAILFRLSRAGHAQMKIARDKGKPGMEPMLDNLDLLFDGQGKSSNKDNPDGESNNGDGPADAPVPVPA